VFGACTTGVAAKVKDATSTGRALWSSPGPQEPRGKFQYGATSPQQIQTLRKPKAMEGRLLEGAFPTENN